MIRKYSARVALIVGVVLLALWSVLGTGTSIAWFRDETETVRNVFNFAVFDLDVEYRNHYMDDYGNTRYYGCPRNYGGARDHGCPRDYGCSRDYGNTRDNSCTRDYGITNVISEQIKKATIYLEIYRSFF